MACENCSDAFPCPLCTLRGFSGLATPPVTVEGMKAWTDRFNERYESIRVEWRDGVDEPSVSLVPRKDFAAEYTGNFAEDPLLPQAVALWRFYYAQCEAYDRTVCTGGMGRDGVLPANSHETALIGRHARGQWYATWEAAVAAGIPDDTMQRARDIALLERR